MKYLTITFYFFYVHNHVLVQMIKSGENFNGLTDIKDFLAAGNAQVREKWKKLNS